MRILQFTDTFWPIMDGVGNVVYQYASHMGQMGHEVYVVTAQTDTGCRGRFPFEIVDYMSVPIPGLKSYNAGTPLLDAHCRRRLGRIDADIVHVHSPFVAGREGLRCARKLGCPVVGTFHSKYYDDFLQITHSRSMARAGARQVAKLYDRLDEVWAVSEHSAETLRDYGCKRDIRVMRNGTDISSVSDEDLMAARERCRLGDAPLLLYVGQINDKKNLRRVLEACAGLKRPYRLVLAGQGPHAKELEQLAERLGIGDRVCFTGHITDRNALNALYRLAALFVFPSLYDNSPLVVREAAAMGTPSVVVAGSSAAEGIVDGENGFLCRDDTADLTRVIETALAQPDKLRAVGNAARATIPVPWGILVGQVLEQYERIIMSR